MFEIGKPLSKVDLIPDYIDRGNVHYLVLRDAEGYFEDALPDRVTANLLVVVERRVARVVLDSIRWEIVDG